MRKKAPFLTERVFAAALLAVPLAGLPLVQVHAQSVGSQAASQPRMRDLVRAWGLDRNGPNVTVASRDVRDNQATFSGVQIKDAAQGDLRVDTVAITRSQVYPGRFVVALQGFSLISTNAEEFKVQTLTIDGMDGATRFAQSLAALSGVGGAAASTPAAQARAVTLDVDISGSDFRFKRPSGGGNLESLQVGSASLSGFQLNGQQGVLRAGRMDGLQFSDKATNMSLGSLSVAQIRHTGLRDLMGASGSATYDQNAIQIGEMRFDNLRVATSDPDKDPFEMKVVGMSLRDWRDGMLGQVATNGISVTIGKAEKQVGMRLADLTMQGLNLAYFGSLGHYMKDAIKLPLQPAQNTAALVQSSFLLAEADVAQTAAPQTPSPAASAPSPRLRDVLKGGPLDSGINGLTMTGFDLSVQGITFDIDRVALAQERNAANIITAVRLDPVTMTLRVPPAMLAQGRNARGGAAIAGLIGDSLRLRISASSTFDPATDVMNVSDLSYELVDWGRINVALRMNGISAMMDHVTMAQLFGVALPMAARSAPGPARPGGARANSGEDLKAYLALLSDVGFMSAQIQVTDTGGLAKVAGLMSGPEEDSPERRQQAVLQTRRGWAEPLRAQAGQKSNPAIVRQIALNLARLVEGGGSIRLNVNPAQPIKFDQFTQSAAWDTPEKAAAALGFSSSYAPPVAQAPAPAPPSPAVQPRN